MRFVVLQNQNSVRLMRRPMPALRNPYLFDVSFRQIAFTLGWSLPLAQTPGF